MRRLPKMLIYRDVSYRYFRRKRYGNPTRSNLIALYAPMATISFASAATIRLIWLNLIPWHFTLAWTMTRKHAF